jgi:hypothetical protein
VIEYSCPKCHSSMSSPESMAGESDECGECGNTTVVPVMHSVAGHATVSTPMAATGPSASLRPGLSASLHMQRIVVAVAAGAGMLATFLPWVKMPIMGSIDGTAGDGWITFSLFAVSLLLAFLGKRRFALSVGSRIGAIAPALLASVLGIWKVFDFKQKMADAPRDNPFAQALASSVQVGAGLYLVIIAGIVLVVLCLAFRKPVAELQIRNNPSP